MKQIKLIYSFIVIMFITSCSDNLNKHCGEVVASKSFSERLGKIENYYLHLKKEGKATLKQTEVSLGEYEYYKEGDTIKCR